MNSENQTLGDLLEGGPKSQPPPWGDPNTIKRLLSTAYEQRSQWPQNSAERRKNTGLTKTELKSLLQVPSKKNAPLAERVLQDLLVSMYNTGQI